MPRKSLRSTRSVKADKRLRGMYRGQTVEFVERTPVELARDLLRIADFARQARRTLRPLLRSKKPELVLAVFQLEYLERLRPERLDDGDLPKAAVDAAIALMSVKDQLAKLENAGSKWMGQALFLLEHGGLRVRKERAWQSKKKEKST